MKSSTLKRFFRLPAFEEHLALHRMDCLAAHANLDIYDFVSERFSSMPEEAVRPTPLLTGRELIAAGYQPGRDSRRSFTPSKTRNSRASSPLPKKLWHSSARGLGRQTREIQQQPRLPGAVHQQLLLTRIPRH